MKDREQQRAEEIIEKYIIHPLRELTHDIKEPDQYEFFEWLSEIRERGWMPLLHEKITPYYRMFFYPQPYFYSSDKLNKKWFLSMFVDEILSFDEKFEEWLSEKNILDIIDSWAIYNRKGHDPSWHYLYVFDYLFYGQEEVDWKKISDCLLDKLMIEIYHKGDKYSCEVYAYAYSAANVNAANLSIEEKRKLLPDLRYYCWPFLQWMFTAITCMSIGDLKGEYRDVVFEPAYLNEKFSLVKDYDIDGYPFWIISSIGNDKRKLVPILQAKLDELKKNNPFAKLDEISNLLFTPKLKKYVKEMYTQGKYRLSKPNGTYDNENTKEDTQNERILKINNEGKKELKFIENITKPEIAQSVLNRLHELIDRQQDGIEKIKPVCAAIVAGIVRREKSYKKFCKEFGYITKSLYQEYTKIDKNGKSIHYTGTDFYLLANEFKNMLV